MKEVGDFAALISMRGLRIDFSIILATGPEREGRRPQFRR